MSFQWSLLGRTAYVPILAASMLVMFLRAPMGNVPVSVETLKWAALPALSR